MLRPWPGDFSWHTNAQWELSIWGNDITAHWVVMRCHELKKFAIYIPLLWDRRKHYHWLWIFSFSSGNECYRCNALSSRHLTHPTIIIMLSCDHWLPQGWLSWPKRIRSREKLFLSLIENWAFMFAVFSYLLSQHSNSANTMEWVHHFPCLRSSFFELRMLNIFFWYSKIWNFKFVLNTVSPSF